MAAREALRLIDAEPVLDAELIALGRWIAGYYCSPLGDVLRGMLPLASEIRQGQNLFADRCRPRCRAPASARCRRRTIRWRRFCACSKSGRSRRRTWRRSCRWPTRRSARSRARLHRFRSRCRRSAIRCARRRTGCAWSCVRSGPDVKLDKPERELLAFLELHPGSHNLKDLEAQVKGASAAARSLARKRLVSLKRGADGHHRIERGPRAARAESAAAGRVQADSRRRSARGSSTPFCCMASPGRARPKCILNAIEAALAAGRSALLLVPEIALTPAMAGQFFARFGDRVAILHSAFTDARARRAVAAHPLRRGRSGGGDALRRVRAGAQSGPDRGGRRARRSYKQEETPRYNGRDVAIVRAQAAGACVVLGSATPSLESRYNARARQVHAARTAGPHRGAADAAGGADRHAPGVSGNAQAGHLFAPAARGDLRASGERRADHAAAQPPRIFQFRGLPRLRRARQCINCSLTLTYHRRDRRLLCHYCSYAEKVPSALPEVPERAHLLSGRGLGEGGRGTASRASRRRGSRGWIATRSPASASTRPSCRTSAKGITTSWWARR